MKDLAVRAVEDATAVIAQIVGCEESEEKNVYASSLEKNVH